MSCGYEFDAVYGHTYAITVMRGWGSTWTGDVVDTLSGKATHIGSWALPSGSGNLRPSQGGFVEYYSSPPNCSQLQWVNVVFGGPTSTDAGGRSGSARAQYEYGNCTGQGNYKSAQVGTGTNISRGWVR
ncbi:hypothetical protein [Actinocrispum wychmicini]|uniref:Uncharacterized protein n=1 Tax=Actinocrispum wychmicini TaxID=1213861 RepID=A0A4R2JUX4_9PSEU|nr:hypothetical protein [Actinocrispum wychmicini]TCO61138.1 hypothetical protein EV192_103722 [Actinocrispum wychmicini]